MIVKSLFAACMIAGVGFIAPAQANESLSSAKPIVVAQRLNVEVNTSPRVRERTVVRQRTVIRHRGPAVRRTVILRHDRGLHRGWRHAPAYGARRTTIIKKRGPLGVTRTRTIIREQ